MYCLKCSNLCLASWYDWHTFTRHVRNEMGSTRAMAIGNTTSTETGGKNTYMYAQSHTHE